MRHNSPVGFEIQEIVVSTLLVYGKPIWKMVGFK
jgi:hypothetical protein